MSLPRDGRVDAPSSGRPVVIVVAASVFVSVLNASIVNVTLPTIGWDLGVDPGHLGWVITSYLLVYAVAIPFYGRLADLYGARRFFLGGQCVFALGSLLCAVAPGYGWLVAARVVQAGGGAAIPGLGITLASRAYPPQERGTVLGVISTTLGVAAAIGPTLGGFVSDALGWHAVFAIGALAGVLVPFGWRVLPRDLPRRGERLDVWGGLFFGVTISGALFAAGEGARGDWGAPRVFMAAAASVVGLAALVVRQRAAAAPFIPRELLANRRFLALIATSFAAMAAIFGPLVGLPLLLTSINGLPPSQVGLALLPNAVLTAVLGIVAGRVVDRVGARTPVRAGLTLVLVAVVGLSTAVGSPAWVMSGLLALLGLGSAFVNTPLSTAVSLLIRPERLASAQSINTMIIFLGGSFGTTLLTATVAARGMGEGGLNPFHAGPGVGFSDGFLILIVPLLVGLALSAAIPGAVRDHGSRAGTPSHAERDESRTSGSELPRAGGARAGAAKPR